MALSDTITALGNSIVNLINSKEAVYFENVAALKSAPRLSVGQVVCTKGYYTANDGGQARYLIRAIAEGDVDDGGSVLTIIGNELVAELIVENSTVNIKQFGAKGDGVTDDTNTIQAVLDFGGNLFFPVGTYKIISTLMVDYSKVSITCAKGTLFDINGLSNDDTAFQFYSTADTVTLPLKVNKKMTGIVLKGNYGVSKNCVGFDIGYEWNTGDEHKRCDEFVFENCSFYGMSTAIRFIGQSWRTTFKNCVFQYVDDYYIYYNSPYDSGPTYTFDNCAFFGGSYSPERKIYLRHGQWHFTHCSLGTDVLFNISDTAHVTIDGQSNIEWEQAQTGRRFMEVHSASTVAIKDCSLHAINLGFNKAPIILDSGTQMSFINNMWHFTGTSPSFLDTDGVTHLIVGGKDARFTAYGNHTQAPYSGEKVAPEKIQLTALNNLLYNGDFEKGTLDGWTVARNWSSYELPSAEQTSGQYCAHLYHDYGSLTQKVKVRPGATLVYSFKTKVVSIAEGSFIKILLTYFDREGNQVLQLNTSNAYVGYSSVTDGWKERFVSTHVPIGADYLNVYVVSGWATNVSTENDIYIDDIVICQC